MDRYYPIYIAAFCKGPRYAGLKILSRGKIVNAPEGLNYDVP